MTFVMKIIFSVLSLGLFLLPITQIQAEEDTPLAKEMESTNDVFKAIKSETDPLKGAALARDAQASILKSLVFVPAMVEKLPAGNEKLKQIAIYRKMVAQSFVIFCDIEEAFLNNKLDDVTKLLDSVKQLKKEGHEKFIED
jgi:hypothetical protein